MDFTRFFTYIDEKYVPTTYTFIPSKRLFDTSEYVCLTIYSERKQCFLLQVKWTEKVKENMGLFVLRLVRVQDKQSVI